MASAAFNCVWLPDKRIVLLLFAPAKIVAPPAKFTCKVPKETTSCTVVKLPSISAIEIVFAPVNANGVSSLTNCVAGTVITGAVLAVTGTFKENSEVLL